MTVYQVHSSTSWPLRNVTWISPTTFYQCVGSGDLFFVAACNQDRRWSTLTPDGLPALFRWRYKIFQGNTTSSVMPSSTGEGINAIGMICPGGGGSPVYSNPLSGHLLNGSSCWGEWFVFNVMVPSSHLNPYLLRHIGFQNKEVFPLRTFRTCVAFFVCLQAWPYLTS